MFDCITIGLSNVFIIKNYNTFNHKLLWVHYEPPPKKKKKNSDFYNIYYIGNGYDC